MATLAGSTSGAGGAASGGSGGGGAASGGCVDELLALYSHAFPGCGLHDMLAAERTLREILEYLNAGGGYRITLEDATPEFVRCVLNEVLHVASADGWLQNPWNNSVANAGLRFAHALNHEGLSAHLGIKGGSDIPQEQLRQRRCDFYRNLLELEARLFRECKTRLKKRNHPSWRGDEGAFRNQRYAWIAKRCGLVWRKPGYPRSGRDKKRKSTSAGGHKKKTKKTKKKTKKRKNIRADGGAGEEAKTGE